MALDSIALAVRRATISVLIVIGILFSLTAAIMLFEAYCMMGPEDWEGFRTCQGDGNHWDSLANYCEGPD
jgi:hypothetical protein